MKEKSVLFITALLIAIGALSFIPACKQDEPVSNSEFKKKISKQWNLESYIKNGDSMDISAAVYMLDFHENGHVTRTINGEILGFSTGSVDEGRWELKDNEELKIIISDTFQLYKVLKLADHNLSLEHKDTAVNIFNFKRINP